MKKILTDLTVVSNTPCGQGFTLMKLQADVALPPIRPGQFAELRVDGSPSTFLRRPISINMADAEKRQVWFLIQLVGDGTRRLASLKAGDRLNAVLPLGNGFTLALPAGARPLLIGGGAGTAPMFFLGKTLKDSGVQPTFILGARTQDALTEMDEFGKLGNVNVTTEDGSLGERGYVTQHPVLRDGGFTHVFCCGPKPMMMAVARYARVAGIDCEVSLENKMACGLGACLCCVENTVGGHRCVCTDGPVFNINDLLWQI